MSRNSQISSVSEKQKAIYECAKNEVGIIKYFLVELEHILPKDALIQLQFQKFQESFKKLSYETLPDFENIKSDEEAIQHNSRLRSNINNLTDNFLKQLHHLLKNKIDVLGNKNFEKNVKTLRENFRGFFQIFRNRLDEIGQHSGRTEETSLLYKQAAADKAAFIPNNSRNMLFPDPGLLLLPMGKVLQTIRTSQPNDYQEKIDAYKNTLIKAVNFYLAFTRICFKTHYNALVKLEEDVFPHLYNTESEDYMAKKLTRRTRGERIAIEIESDHPDPDVITQKEYDKYNDAFPEEPFANKFNGYSPFQLFTAFKADTKTHQHEKTIEKNPKALPLKDKEIIRQIEKHLTKLSGLPKYDIILKHIEKSENEIKEAGSEEEENKAAIQKEEYEKQKREIKPKIDQTDGEVAALIKRLSPAVDPFSILDYIDPVCIAITKPAIQLLTVYGTEFNKARMPAETPKAIDLSKV